MIFLENIRLIYRIIVFMTTTYFGNSGRPKKRDAETAKPNAKKTHESDILELCS